MTPLIYQKLTYFASWINRQVEKYVPWKPEPEVFAADAFL